MEAKSRNLYIGIVVALVVLLVLWWARDRCMLGRYSAKKCISGVGSFCGSPPDPAAAAEAMGLYELGVRGEGFCGTTPAPAALAEYQGLEQLGWRPEHFGRETFQPYRPAACGPPHPASIAEAQSLQHAQALRPGAPYYTKSGFTGGSCGAQVSAEALGEADMLGALQAIAPADLGEIDEMSTHKMRRDQAAYSGLKAHRQDVRSAPGQVSARRARHDSMREGFGGPATAGYGWTPSGADVAASPATAGWGDAESASYGGCLDQCADGCTGTHCHDYCKDQCRDQALLSAAGTAGDY